MIRLVLMVLTVFAGSPAHARIPAEWQAAAQVVIGELERDTPLAARPWTGAELTQGWRLARAWRQYNNGNVEIILAEYLTFVALCRQQGCGENTVDGQGYVAVAQQVKALKAAEGGPYALASNVNSWLATVADPTGAAARNAAMWGKDLDMAAADFATSNLYGLSLWLARRRPTPAEQAATFARFAIFVQGKAWIGARCLDISKVATVLDAPPQVSDCK